MKKCMVIINPSSGKEKASEYEKKIIGQLHNYEVIVKETEGEKDATRFAKMACDEQYDAVILVGGDGTLNEGINGIAEQPHRPVVGVVPLGTVNDFARALDISLDPDEAIALLGGKTTKADIGKVNDHYFTNVIAIGLLAEAVGDVSVEQKTSLGSLAYLFEGVKAAIQNDSYEMEVTADGQTYKENMMLFICVLTDSVGSFRQLNEDADKSDGLLHGFIIKSTSTLQVVGTAKNLLTGNYEDDDNIIKLNAREMHIKATEAFPLNVDGDLISQLPAKISILHNHIEFFAVNSGTRPK
ncbi:sphingosine kinase [Solibacillus silvestris StLB046]|uniref:Sphingosine kinase n=1 Tax=Solibacillus silvestris (strain StLB046) TaxID=1002809 RepID=F2F663_SOLSS|nr:diacylglycerol kinase family protein [Solibacillus silvestris]BAK17467.1 sphingosine kinase [Solibacillus silvestris StLB046]